ncbi:hypothetical protein acdb102_28820 [Acidothermaceae bacterium B102]|nr:hypothetical protein acdb102_28820 [Acidothermaceae bacterium B102]
MPSRRFRRSLSAAIACGGMLTTTLVAVPAHAVEPIVDGPLAFSSPRALTVDSAHSHLLFASGSTNGVIVTDLDGNVDTTVATAGTISDIAMSPDGLYAYASSAAPLTKIYQIKLADLTVVPFSLPAGDCPDSVTVVNATYIAFGYACDGQWGGVGVLKTTDGTVHVTGSEYNPRVRAVPGTTHFISGSVGEDPAQIGLWTVGTGTPSSVIASASVGSCDNLGDIAVNPDGSTFVLACGFPYTHQEFSTVDFSGVATYTSGTYPTAAAFSPDGNYLAAGMNGIYWDDVAVFNHGDGSKVYSFDNSDGGSGPTTPPRGLAFSADSTQLYALAYNTNITPNELYLVTLPVSSAPTFPPVDPPPVAPPVVTPPTGIPTPHPPTGTPRAVPVASEISVASPPRRFVGQPFDLAGTLSFVNGASAAGFPISVTQTVNGVTTGVGSTTTTAGGAFVYPITPNAVGSVTYTVGFVGDTSHYASTAVTATMGARAPAQLALTVAKVKGKVYVVTAHLTSWGVNRHVLISANKKIIGNGVVNAKGLLSVHFTRKKPTTFMAVFTGDRNDYPARAFKGLH